MGECKCTSTLIARHMVPCVLLSRRPAANVDWDVDVRLDRAPCTPCIQLWHATQLDCGCGHAMAL